MLWFTSDKQYVVPLLLSLILWLASCTASSPPLHPDMGPDQGPPDQGVGDLARRQDSAPLPHPVLGLWLLDEGPESAAGWGVFDQSGQGNHGLRRGAPGAAPRYELNKRRPYPAGARVKDYALRFSGGSGPAGSETPRVEIPASPSLGGGGPFTVELWLALWSLSGEQGLVSTRGKGGGGFDLHWSGAGSKLRLRVYTSSGTCTLSSSGLKPVLGSWHHVAAVHDPGAAQNRLFIDGALAAEGPCAGAAAASTAGLRLGNSAAGDAPARASLDQVRLSGFVRGASQLAATGTLGPGRLIFAEGFETYATDSELWARGGPVLNQWRRIQPSGGTVRLLGGGSGRRGQGSVELTLAGDTSSAYRSTYLYYRFPLSLLHGLGKVGFEGWISQASGCDARIFLLSEVFTGRLPPVQPHYGHSQALLAAGIQYDHRTRKWQWEKRGSAPYTAFSTALDYLPGLARFRRFKLVVDFAAGKYQSFHFDGRTWDLSIHPLILFEPDLGHDPTPAMYELNLRLITHDLYKGPYACKVVVDDIAVTNEQTK